MKFLNVHRIVTALELMRQGLPITEVFIKANIDEQVKLLQEPLAAFTGEGGPGGQHLAVMRDFIQRKAINGENVNWGSHSQLQFRGSISVYELEHLATKIAQATIEDFTGRRY